MFNTATTSNINLLTGNYYYPQTLATDNYYYPQTLASGPKADAIILLGSLYTYPWADELLKQQIVVTVKDVAKSESDQFNRSVDPLFSWISNVRPYYMYDISFLSIS